MNHNKKFDSKMKRRGEKVEMVEIPIADYEDNEEPDCDYNEEESEEESDEIQPEDGIGITVDEPVIRPVRNRFPQKNKQWNQFTGKRSTFTLRQAKKIAHQLGVMNDNHENDTNFTNHGFEPETDSDRESSICSIDGQKRLCWAKSCKEDDCKIHSLLRDDDNTTIEDHHHNITYQKINQFKENVSEFWSFILIWSRDLRQIEASYGTGIVSYFYFLRWLLLINVLIACSVILLIIVPQTSFAILPMNEKNNSSMNETNKCTYDYVLNNSSMNGNSESPYDYVVDFLQGTGWMNSTHLFIGKYDRKVVKLPLLGWSYNTTLAYLACTVFYFSFCFILMLKYTTDGMRDTLLAEHHQQYSSMIFCGWDYCTQSKKRKQEKQNSIAMEVKNCQEMDLRKEKALKRSSKDKAKLFIIRLFIFLIVGIILAASLYAIGIVTQISTNNQSGYNSFFKQYSPTLVIFALYLVVPEIFIWLVKYEQYDNETVIKITLMRMVFLRMASVIVLLISLFVVISDPEKNFEQNECWENYIGQSFYKLMVGDLILDVIMVLIVDSLRKLAVSKIAFVKKLLDYQRFEIPKNVLSLVYIQALCWLGTFYCPLMPLICILRLFILYYAQKFTLWKNCSPPDQAYRASRSNIIFILILIISYFISAIPIAYSIGSSRREPSAKCSPFAKYEYKWQPIECELDNWDKWVQTIFNIVTSTAFTLVISFFLCLLTYYYIVRGLIHKKTIDAVRSELKGIAVDRIYLISELSFLQIRQELS